MCQICLDLMHKPYALAPCGHLACYECLVQWFTAPPPGTPGAAGAAPVNGQPGNANLNVDVPAPAPQPNYRAYARKKTCPHCRSVVQDRPVEVWGIKSMVSGLVHSGLLAGSLPPVPALRLPDANMADPWAGIFRKPYNFDHQPHGDPEASIEDMGMYDAEDGGIYRCLDCMHEIWGGVCSGCHREYPGHHDSDDSDDEGPGLWGGPPFMDMDMMDEDEEGYELEDLENDFDEDEDDDDDDDNGENGPGLFPFNPFDGLMHMAWGMAMGLGRHANHHGGDDGVARVEEIEDGGEDDDEGDEDEEEDYGGSFIDDGDDEVHVNPRRRSSQADVEIIDIEASDDEEVNPRRLRRQGAIRVIEVSSDEEEPRASGSRHRAPRLFPSDDEDNSAIHATIRRIAARRRMIDDSDGENESDAEEQSL